LFQSPSAYVCRNGDRSFDNLLGWLYDPANDPPFDAVPSDFDGLYGKNL
jgi:hypothetical protein